MTDGEKIKMKNGIDVIIPVFRPQKELHCLLEALEDQTIKPGKIIIMNTEDPKGDVFFEENGILEKYDNIEIYSVKKEEFDHGKTRDQGISHSQAPFFFCITQDAVPKDRYLLENLWKSFEDPKVSVSYGRQLPRKDAHILEEYTREFNYPKDSIRKKKEDLNKLGIKTYFCSNVCAMYRRSDYDRLGGFPQKTIFNEDMIFASWVISAGLEIQYVAEAMVIHSHHYSAKEQFHRNFDLGVSQADYSEIFQKVKSESEGIKLIQNTIRYLISKKKAYYIPLFIYQTAWKYIGYRMGKEYRKLPLKLVYFCSMNKNYWLKKE